ncbi:MAG: hypothetical protein ACLP9L_10395, partial [Thermoguttaceae bacterium]
MRHPFSSATAAAIFVLAVVGVGLWFHGGGATPAFADFLQPLLDAKTVKYKMIIETMSPPAGMATMSGLSAEEQKELMKPRTSVVMEMGSHRTRNEDLRDKIVTIWDGDQHKQLVLQPAEKRATLYDYSERSKDKASSKKHLDLALPQGRPEEPGSVALFRALLLDTVRKPDVQRKPLGEKEIDGRQVVGFCLSGHGAVLSVWGDPKTRLPVRVEGTFALMPNAKLTESDFEFNVPMDGSLFSLEPPTGYKLVVKRSQPSDDSPEGETDLIELFRYYGRWSGGRFPNLLDMQWIHGVVREAEWLDANLPPHKPEAMRDRQLEELMRKLQRGMMFTVLLPKESDWHYAGRGVSIGAADTPVFWYRPKDAKKYRVIYADLSVQEADTPPQAPVVPVVQMEQDLIEMLRQYSELNDGFFPDAPDSAAFTKIIGRERQKEDDPVEPRKPSAKEERKVPRWLAKLQQGVIFVGLLPKQSDWHYAGKNAPLGAADRPIFWYRPKDSKTYRVVYADLSVRDANAPPSTPAALPEPGWPQGNCTIAGKVVAEATGKPVPGACVYLFYRPTS